MEHRDQIRKIYELSFSHSQVPARIEYMRLYRDGSKQSTEIIAKRSMFGNDMANIGICRDISERVELENKYRETEKLKALAQQAASLAHEVRNPLSTVRMNMQLFSETEMDPERFQLLQVCLAEVTQIERSLQEMMDISC
jgi:nitrogen-specific signal transduction histidine kinase